MTLQEKLTAIAAIWCEQAGRSQSRLATIVANDGKIFDRLAAGRSCTIATFEKFVGWFREPANWGDGGIPAAAADVLDTLPSHASLDIADLDDAAGGKSDDLTGQAVAA